MESEYVDGIRLLRFLHSSESVTVANDREKINSGMEVNYKT